MINTFRLIVILTVAGPSIGVLMFADHSQPSGSTVLATDRDLPTRATEYESRVYRNRLTLLADPRPILADFPEYVDQVIEETRFEAPALIEDDRANLDVRAWRYSYNARGIIEIPNRLRGSDTALVVVHPWGVDDGQGWQTPQPAGAAFACTPTKNQGLIRHARDVVNPFLTRLRPHVGDVIFSLPGDPDPIRTALYRTMESNPNESTRRQAESMLRGKLSSFDYSGSSLPTELELSDKSPVEDYFRQFPGLSAGDKYNAAGFWELPIPVMNAIDVDSEDVVVFDNQGYPALRDYLRQRGIRHILLCGYAADMCVCSTTAGYENLRKDFNVFLIGDAVQATNPANIDAAAATNQAVSFASLNLLISQVSWVATHDD